MQYLPYIIVTLIVIVWWMFNRKEPKIHGVGSRSYILALFGSIILFLFLLCLTYLNTKQYLSVADFLRSIFSKELFNEFSKFSSIWVIVLIVDSLINLFFTRKN